MQASRTRPTVAVITMARDEGDLMRVWVDHYARHVGIENIVVLDDNSEDGSTDDLGCTVHRLPPLQGGEQFEPTRMRLMNGLSNALLAAYDYVIFTDVDEFLVTDPGKYPTVPDLIEARGRPGIMGVVALNLVHVPTAEPEPLDLGHPILRQRAFAKFTPLMCKPSVKREAAGWTASSHGIKAPYAVEPELFMIHLKFGDRGRLAAVSALRNEVSRTDGRAEKASWGKQADEMLAVFDEVVADVDPASVPEFDPYAVDLDSVVVHIPEQGKSGERWRTPKRGQLGALQVQPLVRVPERIRDAL